MMPLRSRTRPALISRITSGKFGSIRKAEELSTTTAPALTAIGASVLEMPLPSENRAMSSAPRSRRPCSRTTSSCRASGSWPALQPAKAKAAAVRGGENSAPPAAGDRRQSRARDRYSHFPPFPFEHDLVGNSDSTLPDQPVQTTKKCGTNGGGASVELVRSVDE